jgi:hypothetical protein
MTKGEQNVNHYLRLAWELDAQHSQWSCTGLRQFGSKWYMAGIGNYTDRWRCWFGETGSQSYFKHLVSVAGFSCHSETLARIDNRKEGWRAVTIDDAASQVPCNKCDTYLERFSNGL